jgi:serine/threonine protein kinase
MPIEILIGEKYSSKCDVFSVGIILYEMVSFFKSYLEKTLFITEKK